MEQPHVLMFPFPAQGHVKPFRCLAQLLCNAGVHVTFLNTHHNRRRLADLQPFSVNFPTLHFDSIADGLPDDHPRSLHHSDLLDSLKAVTKPLLRDFLVSSGRELPPITHVIADGIMSFAVESAVEVGIPAISFNASSASCSWAFHCVPELIELGKLPFGEEVMDREISGVPGLEGVFRYRDLPRPYRARRSDDPYLQFFVNEKLASARYASALVLNTVDELEAPALAQLRSLFPNVYTIGPVHALLKSRTGAVSWPISAHEEDRGCLEWLDSQPPRSVVFVSFGSLLTVTRVQVVEFWHGLVSSGKPFLWVIRPDMVAREPELGPRLKGLIVDWAPQEEVLAHPSVGAFLTHSGWNSTMEAVVAGVPMICWPNRADQLVNSRLVGHVWMIGLDMKDTCDRSTVEMMIKKLMENQSEQIVKSMDQIKKVACTSIAQGGSSYNNLEKLIQYIRN